MYVYCDILSCALILSYHNVIGFNAGTEISIQDVAALAGIKGLDILD